MFKNSFRLTDQQVETMIGNLLRISVIIAALVVLLGGVIYLIHFHFMGTHPDYRVFTGEPRDLRTVSGILRDSLTIHSRGIIQLGLLVLIATPVARVILALFAFALQRDRIYVVVCLIVLTVLIYSLSGGRL